MTFNKEQLIAQSRERLRLAFLEISDWAAKYIDDKIFAQHSSEIKPHLHIGDLTPLSEDQTGMPLVLHQRDNDLENLEEDLEILHEIGQILAILGQMEAKSKETHQA